MSERSLARGVVAFTAAAVVSTFFWFWAELNWKNLGGRASIVAVACAGFALAVLWAERMARRPTPIDWIHELVRTAMLATLVSGVGVLVSRLGDATLGGSAPRAPENNQPSVVTPLFVTLMLTATLVATSSVLPIWRHRHAVRTSPDAPLAETLAACGAWLSGVVVVLAAVGFVTGVELARLLVPHATLALALVVAWFVRSLGRAPRHFDRAPMAFAISGASLAALSLAVGLTGFPIPGRDVHRDRTACLAAGHPGLFLDSRGTRVTAYRARGVELRRVECRSTFQYNDERFAVVVGRDASGRDVRGAELFARVLGSPLERARAACEILLADRCQAPLLYPSEIAGFTGLPVKGLLVPHEQDGRLAFVAVTYEYPHGRSSSVGRRRVAVPYEVELKSGRLHDVR